MGLLWKSMRKNTQLRKWKKLKNLREDWSETGGSRTLEGWFAEVGGDDFALQAPPSSGGFERGDVVDDHSRKLEGFTGSVASCLND
ncbi:putative protein dimerization [Corchorus olitorius]|uniref:Uncharacterized protein n=1 Tax=Corchorus olitorius TaxID=93759 RepID=A0A1R3KEX8_9ROSI|nr:putative protein dimerization [Corchorus olitorius]